MRTVDPLAGTTAFLAVADALSFSRAAEALGLSRATIGAQLRALENRLGVRLLQRSTRSVTLTEAGIAYRDALAGIVPQIREAERVATSFQEEAVGRLRISAAPDLGALYLAPLIADFLEVNPAVSIDLDLSYRDVALVDERFDLAIRGTIAIEDNLITRRIGASPIRICAAPRYLERAGIPETPEQLATHACLHFAGLRWGRNWVMHRSGREWRVPILPRLEVNDGRTLLAAALAGGGITLLPGFLLGPDIRAGKLVPLLTDWTIADVPLHAVYPANRHIARKVRAFVTFLVHRLAKQPDVAR